MSIVINIYVATGDRTSQSSRNVAEQSETILCTFLGAVVIATGQETDWKIKMAGGDYFIL